VVYVNKSYLSYLKTGPINVMKIGITSVFVHDPVSAFHFYTEVLGFVKKTFIPEKWIAIVVSPEDREGTSLMLEPNHNAIAKRYQLGLYKAGIPVIVFTTPDIKQEHERLVSLGVHFRKEPVKTKDGIEALFEDGFGNIILLYEA
jgi:catechol 2,3-dioxygenase-like lactoylglutathione lyase family enzyme